MSTETEHPSRRKPDRSAAPPPSTTASRAGGRPPVRILVVFLIALGSAGLVFADWWWSLPDSAEATYVGGQRCMSCHAEQAAKWKGSYHDLAMDRATPETVLGNFDNAQLTHFGLTSTMFRRDGKYMVRTEGPDGKLEDFEVSYVLGVAPLQQYMVEFDRPANADPDAIGRLQVLPICWDTKKKEWFFLQPPDVAERVLPGDDLHWTGIAQRWNNMCADCHTTNLKKGYDVSQGTYHTTFTDMNVSCEACHGPGSLHVQLATAKSLFWDRKRGYALAKLKSQDPRVEIETCAPCHSMRHLVKEGHRGGEPYFDYFANELLHGHLYHTDGQILEEVYEYGSFLQSKMYQKGIRCTDCHDAHTTQVKHPGNQLCTSCHQHPAGKYDAPAHHRHNPQGVGAQCTACHMPKKTYMAVDPRLDHSLRVPRPDLSVKLSTPNACSGCHLEKSGLSESRRQELGEYANWLQAARNGDEQVREALAKVDAWAAEQFTGWYGKKADADTHFANVLAAARRGDSQAESQLIDLAENRGLPAIVRATCLFELGQFGSDATVQTALQLLDDAEPLVRLAALPHLDGLPDEQLVKHVMPLLDDPLRAVRAEAGRVLARVDIRWLTGPQRTARDQAIDEYRQGLIVNSDRALGHLGLGVLAEQLGEDRLARQSYETAIQVEPTAAGPRANLAALLERVAEQRGDEAAASQLRQRIRQLRHEELELLGRDARLAPRNPVIRYRYGLSLYLHGQMTEAEHELQEAVRLSPQTPDFVLALALLYQKQMRLDEAIEETQKLLALRPDDPMIRQLLVELQTQQQQAPRSR